MKTAAQNPGSRVAKKIRVRAMLFFAFALLGAVAAVVLIKNFLDSQKFLGAIQSRSVKVVVAAMDLPIATRLEEQHVKVVEWPAASVPDGAVLNPKDIYGRTIRQGLVHNELLLQGRLVNEKHGAGLAAILSEGTRAMAVKVDQVVGIAGFVQPADYVDVITTMEPDDETRRGLDSQAARVSKIILQNIKVLAVGEHMTTDGRKPVKVQVVTLEVLPEQSEKLALASRHGKIQLTMRSRIDQETVPTAGITPFTLLRADVGAAQTEKASSTSKSSSSSRSSRRRSRRSRSKDKQEPQQPVVEILRGTRGIEQRKLRRTADSQ